MHRDWSNLEPKRSLYCLIYAISSRIQVFLHFTFGIDNIQISVIDLPSHSATANFKRSRNKLYKIFAVFDRFLYFCHLKQHLRHPCRHSTGIYSILLIHLPLLGPALWLINITLRASLQITWIVQQAYLFIPLLPDTILPVHWTDVSSPYTA